MSVGTQDFLVELDGLYPSERLEKLNLLSSPEEAEKLKRDEWRVLASLYLIDNVVRSEFGSNYFFYVLNDASVFELVKLAGFSHIDEDRGHKMNVLLGAAQLIYRFNAAKKFSISNGGIKQLRLNSWGRAYISKNDILNELKDEVALLTNSFKLYLSNNIAAYGKLTKLLLSDISPETAKMIMEINSDLKIQLVS